MVGSGRREALPAVHKAAGPLRGPLLQYDLPNVQSGVQRRGLDARRLRHRRDGRLPGPLVLRLRAARHDLGLARKVPAEDAALHRGRAARVLQRAGLGHLPHLLRLQEDHPPVDGVPPPRHADSAGGGGEAAQRLHGNCHGPGQPPPHGRQHTLRQEAGARAARRHGRPGGRVRRAGRDLVGSRGAPREDGQAQPRRRALPDAAERVPRAERQRALPGGGPPDLLHRRRLRGPQQRHLDAGDLHLARPGQERGSEDERQRDHRARPVRLRGLARLQPPQRGDGPPCQDIRPSCPAHEVRRAVDAAAGDPAARQGAGQGGAEKEGRLPRRGQEGPHQDGERGAAQSGAQSAGSHGRRQGEEPQGPRRGRGLPPAAVATRPPRLPRLCRHALRALARRGGRGDADGAEDAQPDAHAGRGPALRRDHRRARGWAVLQGAAVPALVLLRDLHAPIAGGGRQLESPKEGLLPT
mmetsp:Transcript_48178/g.148712  ORF Transcript_48178/g.148712 Transcript_48178/m.148712 type:complete len:468 (+) Transcript_48178:667-2070(+)